MKKKLDKKDKALLRKLSKYSNYHSPSAVAKAADMHPSTAISRLKKLREMELIRIKMMRKRQFIKGNKGKIKSALKRAR